MEYLEQMRQTDKGVWPMVLQGQVRMVEGRADLAMPFFVEALELDPELVHTQLNLGHCLASLGRLPEALDAFRQVLAIDSKNTIALDMLIKMEKDI